jgi:hypothetical protein
MFPSVEQSPLDLDLFEQNHWLIITFESGNKFTRY